MVRLARIGSGSCVAENSRKEKVLTYLVCQPSLTFSFRLFSATQMPDPILASRTIVVPLIRSNDRNRTNISSEDPDAWPHDRQKLIDDLWLLALAHMPKLKECEAAINASSTLTGRNLEPWRALLAVANWLSEITNYELRITNEEGRSEFVTRNSTLVTRMMALSVAYQQERPNVEAADIGDSCRPKALVIRSMGMILGKLIKDEANTTSTTCTTSTTTNKSYFVPTYLVTGAVQTLIEAFEYDYQLDQVTNTKVGKTLTKMRLVSKRGSNGGKRGWIISLGELIK